MSRYIEDDDGYYKLQLSKYECLDIQEQTKIKLINPNKVIVRKKNNVCYYIISNIYFQIIKYILILG